LKCEVCGREAESRFCEAHEMAYRNLKGKYEEWRSAMDITWEDYLREVLKNPLTGVWVKEVAEHLLSKSESPDSDRGDVAT